MISHVASIQCDGISSPGFDQILTELCESESVCEVFNQQKRVLLMTGSWWFSQ